MVKFLPSPLSIILDICDYVSILAFNPLVQVNDMDVSSLDLFNPPERSIKCSKLEEGIYRPQYQIDI